MQNGAVLELCHILNIGIFYDNLNEWYKLNKRDYLFCLFLWGGWWGVTRALTYSGCSHIHHVQCVYHVHYVLYQTLASSSSSA